MQNYKQNKQRREEAQNRRAQEKEQRKALRKANVPADGGTGGSVPPTTTSH